MGPKEEGIRKSLSQNDTMLIVKTLNSSYVLGHIGIAAVAEEAKDLVAEFQPTINKYNIHLQQRKSNTRMLN